MSTADGNPTIQELQRHARWIRSLAGALLRDETAAEDLAQEAWVAALTHPPAAGRLRPWLRRVAHNFAGQHQRRTARRVAREQEARPPAGPEAPDAYAERLEAEQRLTRALAALAEPFRSTLMLRFYEDLEPAEIAARLGLPGGTVRWRLMRGLALLRERLDEAHGGDRRAWSLALLPLARLDGAAGTAAAGVATSAVVLPGIVAMNALKLSVSAAALLVLALGMSLSGLLPDALTLGARREAPLEVSFRPLLDEVDVPAVPEPPPSAVARIALESASEPEAEPAVAPGESTVDARVSGRGRTLGDARLVVVHDGARHETRSASGGFVQCSFALAEPSALVRVELHALGFASQLREVVCEAGGTTHLGRIELAPGGAVSGRLVDERGLAIVGGRVTLGALDEPYQRLEAGRLEAAPDGIPACASEADGRFRLLGVPAGMVRLWAHADGRKAAYSPPFEVREGQESLGVELVLEPIAPANLLCGIVLDPAGAPVPGAKIEYRHVFGGGSTVQSGTRNADGEGRFEFRLPADTRSWLRGTDPAGRFAAGSLADVANSERELVLQLAEAREVELLVRGRSRTPLETFAVDLRGVDDAADMDELTEAFGAERAEELVARNSPRLGGLARAQHDGGRAEVALPDQPFFLRVLAPGHRVFQLGPLEPARVGATLECTLEPVPGLAGVVLRDGAPVAGARVALFTEVEADMKVEVDGYRVRIHPDEHDQALTGADGSFLLTARAPGSYFVRAEPPTGAPAEIGPLVVDATLGGPPLELHLGEGGAIEGRVRLAGGADPEGRIVGITRGDGGQRTRRVGSDGRFRFAALLPGPWRVELREEEVFGPPMQISSTQGPGVRPFELGENCTVYEGETTFVDVSDAALESVSFEGHLLVDERPAVGWMVKLGPVGRLEIEDGGWSALDGDGRFALRAPGPGDYRLTLRLPGGEFQEQYLFDDVVVRGDTTSWEHALHTGKLRLRGVADWSGEGAPPAVHFWRGPGQLFALTVPVGDGARAIDVPAGPAELRAPTENMDPTTWRVLRTIEVHRGEELTVELSPAELGAR